MPTKIAASPATAAVVHSKSFTIHPRVNNPEPGSAASRLGASLPTQCWMNVDFYGPCNRKVGSILIEDGWVPTSRGNGESAGVRAGAGT